MIIVQNKVLIIPPPKKKISTQNVDFREKKFQQVFIKNNCRIEQSFIVKVTACFRQLLLLSLLTRMCVWVSEWVREQGIQRELNCMCVNVLLLHVGTCQGGLG